MFRYIKTMCKRYYPLMVAGSIVAAVVAFVVTLVLLVGHFDQEEYDNAITKIERACGKRSNEVKSFSIIKSPGQADVAEVAVQIAQDCLIFKIPQEN